MSGTPMDQSAHNGVAVPSVGTEKKTAAADQENDRKGTANAPVRPSERKYAQNLLCRLSYENNLPSVPCEPKLLHYPMDPQRFIRYRPSSIEVKHKFDIVSESHLSVPIDLVDPAVYRAQPNAVLAPADRALVEDNKEGEHKDVKKRRETHHMEVYWLRKTQWISSEHRQYGMTDEQIEEKRLRRREREEEDIGDERQRQILSIERSFNEANDPGREWVHPIRKERKAVEVLPVLPGRDAGERIYTAVIFDSDPAPANIRKPAPGASEAVLREHQRAVDVQNKQMALGVLYGTEAHDGTPYTDYFIPTEETLTWRESMGESGQDVAASGEPQRYKFVREYDYDMRAAREDDVHSYALLANQGAVHYYRLSARTALKRRRALDPNAARLTHANVTYR